jgi:N-acylneuraminate cytidylyltransferase
MWRIEGGVLVPLVDSGIEEQYNRPRQELPTAYWQIGTLDVIRTPTITELGSMSGRRILPMIVDRELAVDIDDAESFRAAEEAARRLGLAASP